MGKLSDLADAIAGSNETERARARHVARLVRETGLILSPKSGSGASPMTFRDAAVLLMATHGDVTPAGAVLAARNLLTLQPRRWNSADEDVRRSERSQRLAFLRPDLSFADTLTTMIENAPVLEVWAQEYKARRAAAEPPSSAEAVSMERLLEQLDPATEPVWPGYAREIRVIFCTPGFTAEVQLGRQWEWVDDPDVLHEHFTALHSSGGEPDDTITSREVGLATLLRLNKAVRDPVVHPRRLATLRRAAAP